MATTTVIVDDLDGSTGAETVTFSFQGETYEIDLVKKNRSAFEKTMKPYLDAARRSSGRGGRGGRGGGRRAAASSSSGSGRSRSRGSSRSSSSSSSSTDLAAVRAWANQNGYQVSSRGRIPQQILDAYQAAQG